MAEFLDIISLEAETSQEDGTHYLTIKQAAEIIKVSERSVYGYVSLGKLPGVRLDGLLMVKAADVSAFRRRSPGRVRTTTPRWRLPPFNNPQYVTTIRAFVRPGQGERLERMLAEIRALRKHLLPGTAARYIMRDPQYPERVLIVLIWYGAAMPPEEECKAALTAFYADLACVLDWETAITDEGQVLVHA